MKKNKQFVLHDMTICDNIYYVLLCEVHTDWCSAAKVRCARASVEKERKSMQNIIAEITKDQLRTDLPEFRAGDTVTFARENC